MSAAVDELPRLTGLLRNCLRPEGAEINIQQETLSRSTVLYNVLKEDRKNATTTWKTFTASLEAGAKSRTEVSNSCKSFIRAVNKLIGEEPRPTEEIQEAAMFVYSRIAESMEKPSSNAKLLVETEFGYIQHTHWQQVVSLATRLWDYKNAGEPAPSRRGNAAPMFGENLVVDMKKGEGGNPLLEDDELVSDLTGASASGPRAAKKATSQRKVDALWLATECSKHVSTLQAQGTETLSATELAESLLQYLSGDSSDEALQNDLFELIGFDNFEFVQKLLEWRQDIVEVEREATSRGSDVDSRVNAATLGDEPKMPSFATQVTVQSTKEKNFAKLRRKEEKKAGRRGDDHEGRQWMQESAMDARMLREEREAQLRAGVSGSSVNKDTLAPAGSTQWYGGGSKGIMLPEGTERIVKKGYEEVRVPPAVQQPKGENERLIPISELDEVAQVAFRGMKSLNRIQSKLFESAYRSNTNLLVCAPTGAGKTNIALLTILREVHQHLSGGVLKKDAFKIVYVAPMKALAAEVVDKFNERLSPLGLVVKELTGDMQLTRTELNSTHIIVTTPEKWDVITRKSSDVALTQMVKLLIIDEVHLLHEDRGPVIEILVARTLRQVESTQSMIRIVGLSATLPNYKDVAVFLRVDPQHGLFFFDNSYRPVPLEQNFIGVKEAVPLKRIQAMNEICYDKLISSVKKGNQVMVFVHSRKDTVKTSRVLKEMAEKNLHTELFAVETHAKYAYYKQLVDKSKNKDLRELFTLGFGVHHAGMLRSDRTLTERMFTDGILTALSCTATLAWGVNLPAHTVIIKGTQIYNAEVGTFVELGMLDVMQIFGRAGRPQFDTSGEGIIITSHDKLNHYLSLLTQQLPIESQFTKRLCDNLNAEIVLGTVTNMREAISWLSYTYLYIRMLRNPMVYGISYDEIADDPILLERRQQLLTDAAAKLDGSKMIRFHKESGTLHAVDLGRVASHYYIAYESVQTYNTVLKPTMADPDVLMMFSMSSEFQNVKERDEEMEELGKMSEECPVDVKGGAENSYGKTNILLQGYISQAKVDNFALICDMNYISSNASRIMRALFEICLRRGWTSMTDKLLTYAKCIDRRMWDYDHPLMQFNTLPPEVVRKLDRANASIEKIKDMAPSEIGHLVRHQRLGNQISKIANQFPVLGLSAELQPITRTVLRVTLSIDSEFNWNDKVHGNMEPWWIWVEDPENEHIYYNEYLLYNKKMTEDTYKITFTIPIFEPLPPQYYIRAVSDRWIGAETCIAVSFQHLILPEQYPPHTELLDLHPLPKEALAEKYRTLYPRFTHFNPIQTQLFHTAYHTDHNVLLGAPTGSGKTIASELCMFRLFEAHPGQKVIYIAPLKALVRERMEDWKVRLVKQLGKSVVELTGDYTPDMRALLNADVITTTPEKWDGISRNWRGREYVKKVGLVVIDEIHLLGEERGAILEVIVSRMRYISSQTGRNIRLVGLSTALANARDVAEWLGIERVGLFNFRPSVRPVPLECHIEGFQGKHYCPRMKTMNKPAYSAIVTHSPKKPVLVFVSSRRQTRLTAFDLIAFAAADENPRRFLHMPEDEMDILCSRVKDSSLKHTLAFGIGLHHSGLNEGDKTLCEDLFLHNKIQVLVSTSTLAWGVNLPAHLVVVKGTEFFDGKQKRYVDFPITDVLQMMGRAGRPQFDDAGVASILVHEPKKSFYKKFLYEPFPVESHLHNMLHNHLNAEVVSGTVSSKQDAMDYLTWTYYFRRLLMNPSYYGLDDTDDDSVNRHLSDFVQGILNQLEAAGCVEVQEDNAVYATNMGRIASYYYLDFKTMHLFANRLTSSASIPDLLQILCDTAEYEELPVRHNEDLQNQELAKSVPWSVDERSFDSPHIKANLILQAHFHRAPLPVSDYITDTKSVLDQAVRILNAMVDVVADAGWLETTLNTMNLAQMVIQGRWLSDSTLLNVPGISAGHLESLHKAGIDHLCQVLPMCFGKASSVSKVLSKAGMNAQKIQTAINHLKRLPLVDVSCTLNSEGDPKPWEETSLTVHLERVNEVFNTTALTSKFNKQKNEGWWIVVGDPQTNELLALKRVTFASRHLWTRINVTMPERLGKHRWEVHLVSDCYIGLDIVHAVDFNVAAAEYKLF